MPQETKLMPFPDSVDDLLQQLEDLFEEPYQHECNCGKDPEGCCDFCSTFERSRNKARKLMEAWNTSPTSPTSPDWIKEASEEIEMRSASLARAIVSTENLDQSKVEPLTFAIRNVMKEILTKHAAGLVEDKERLDWAIKLAENGVMRALDIAKGHDHKLPTLFNVEEHLEQLRTAITAAMKGTK